MFVPQRGILVSAGGSHRPCGCPAPIRRARRARKRPWAGWASARSPRGAPWGACSDAVRGLARSLHARCGILMCVSGSHAPCAPPTPSRRAQRARAGAPRAPRGSGAPHGPPRRSATLTQMEPVRALTRRDALRGAMTHPVTHSTLGARVVGTVGHHTVVLGSQGVISD